MIHFYGVTQQGHYHIKNNLVCQDAHLIVQVSEDFCYAAVADGLGSEQYTDIAAKIAVESVINYCKDKITDSSNPEDILIVLKEAYYFSLTSIEETAQNNGHDVNQYDTTLSMVLFIKDKIYYGQSGDSGIVVLKTNGEYMGVAVRQRDENGCVFPLCFTDKWDFGIVEEVASVLLATDGMLETLYPSLLYNEPVNIYVALAQFLMDNMSLGFANNSDEQVQEKISSFVENIAEAQVSDDKTIVCLVNTDTVVERKEEEYYQVPDWQELKRKKDEEFRRLAYPHLYKEHGDKKE